MTAFPTWLRSPIRLALAVGFGIVALAPVTLLAAYSVFEQNDLRFEPAFELGAFSEAISGPGNLSLLVKTLTNSLLAAGIATTLAFALVYCATIVLPRWHQPGARRLPAGTVRRAFLVRIFAWRTLLGQEGHPSPRSAAVRGCSRSSRRWPTPDGRSCSR